MVAEGFKSEKPFGSGRSSIAIFGLASEVIQYPFHTILLVIVKSGAFSGGGITRSQSRRACEMEVLLWLHLENLPHRQMKTKPTIKCSMYITGMCINGSYKLDSVVWLPPKSMLYDHLDFASLTSYSKVGSNSSA